MNFFEKKLKWKLFSHNDFFEETIYYKKFDSIFEEEIISEFPSISIKEDYDDCS